MNQTRCTRCGKDAEENIPYIQKQGVCELCIGEIKTQILDNEITEIDRPIRYN